MKKLRVLLTTLVLIIVLSASVFAADNYRNIRAFFGINLNINGRNVTPRDGNGRPLDVLVIEGITYVPVRFVSESLGHNVDWDEETKTVLIDSAKSPSQEDFISEVTQEFAIYTNGTRDFSIESFTADDIKFVDIEALAYSFYKDLTYERENNILYTGKRPKNIYRNDRLQIFKNGRRVSYSRHNVNDWWAYWENNTNSVIAPVDLATEILDLREIDRGNVVYFQD